MAARCRITSTKYKTNRIRYRHWRRLFLVGLNLFTGDLTRFHVSYPVSTTFSWHALHSRRCDFSHRIPNRPRIIKCANNRTGVLMKTFGHRSLFETMNAWFFFKIIKRDIRFHKKYRKVVLEISMTAKFLKNLKFCYWPGTVVHRLNCIPWMGGNQLFDRHCVNQWVVTSN